MLPGRTSTRHPSPGTARAGPASARHGSFAVRQRGSLALRLAVGLFAIAAGAVLLAPLARRLAIERRATAAVQQLQAFSAAFQAQAHDRGDWPPMALPGEVPPGMSERLAGTNWSGTAPIGGQYRWIRRTPQQGQRFEAAIAITSAEGNPVSDDRALLEEMDRLLDDGELTTGRFRLGYRNQPLLVLEP
jgi:type II secretory pathway pseudopilin PulG